MVSDLDVYTFGDDFFHQLASTFQQADGAVGLGLAVVWVVWFIEDHHRSLFPRVGP